MPATFAAKITSCGNGLAIRFTKPMAAAAGVADGSPVRLHVEPGRIVIETEAGVAVERTLEQMLAAFDPKHHGGEAMTFSAVGVEVPRAGR